MGLLELYPASGFDPGWLGAAMDLQRRADELLWDTSSEGYFQQAEREASRLPSRPKPFTDGALPSGNGVMLSNLLRLWKLTGREEYLARARQLARSALGRIRGAPVAHTSMIRSAGLLLDPGMDLIIASRCEESAVRMVDMARRFPSRDLAVHLIHPGNGEELSRLAPFLESVAPSMGDGPVAYLCTGFSCRQPIADPAELERGLRDALPSVHQ